MKTLSKSELGWLAGIIDGEGCLYARKVNKGSFDIRLDLQAVSKDMIDHIELLLSRLNVEYKRQPPTLFKLSTRPAERIRVHKKKSLFKLLNKLLPLMIVKKREAERILKYLSKATTVARYKRDASDSSLIDDVKNLKLIA